MVARIDERVDIEVAEGKLTQHRLEIGYCRLRNTGTRRIEGIIAFLYGYLELLH
jgi:hypothetical protein